MPELLTPIDIMNTPMHSHTVLVANWEVTVATVPTLVAHSSTIAAITAAQSGRARDIIATSIKAKQPR